MRLFSAVSLMNSSLTTFILIYRLVPRKGAGPDLRKEGGGRIDEYLMRLLRNGNSQSAETRQAVLKVHLLSFKDSFS